ncbi:hypothetical protein EGW08_022116 [Elysia chlorotica]|uniref:C-type lectin domain-containing protein n=1 Tax=Elysia chlorotica TaxID=188477 RepID=A0A3S1H155_ELYCH|nr:hypothetical protein EGW08_022116 [Elysia chlorotica]
MVLRNMRDFEIMLSVVVLVLCMIKPAKLTAQDPLTDLKFSVTDPTSVSPLVPYRLTSPGWTGMSSVLACAQRTVSTYPESRGFLYNSVSGLCTPLFWLQGPGADNATGVTSQEGAMYLAKDVCPQDFQVLEYGSKGQLACIKDSTDSQNYGDATSACNALQSRLVAVRTAEKLELVRSISGGDDKWVGLDDLVEEGKMVWQIDGGTMIQEERDAIFPSHEPNDMKGNEDCVQFRGSTQLLNDKSCDEKHGFICEVALPGFT